MTNMSATLGATFKNGILLNQSKFDKLNNFEYELPFHRTELDKFVERFVGNNLDFIDKESLTIEEIKDHHLNYDEWKTQLSDKKSNLSKLFSSQFFVDEEAKSSGHRIMFWKLATYGIMSSKGTLPEKVGSFVKLIAKMQTVPRNN